MEAGSATPAWRLQGKGRASERMVRMGLLALIFVLLLAAWLAACLSVYVARQIHVRRRKAARLQARIQQIIQTY